LVVGGWLVVGWLMFDGQLLKTNSQCPRPTEHPTPNTQHSTPNTQHRTPNTQHPTPNTQHPIFP
jgi:hypothetical protein